MQFCMLFKACLRANPFEDSIFESRVSSLVLGLNILGIFLPFFKKTQQTIYN